MPPAGHTYVLNQKLLSLSGDLWIEDEQGNNAFQVDGKAFSLRRTLILLDPSGNPLYAIGKSLAHLHRTFEIKRSDAVVATIQEALVNFLGDHFTITSATRDQLSVKGNFIDREFRVSRGGADVIVAYANGSRSVTATESRSRPTSRRRSAWRSWSPSSRWS
jgi:uncharacterized protein YxjI